MLSVKGTFQKGVVHPLEPVVGRDGQAVIITFLEEENAVPSPPDDEAWKAMERLIEACSIETGIRDLAHQHDHYQLCRDAEGANRPSFYF